MLNLVVHIKEFKLKLYYIILSFVVTFLISYLFAPQLINILSSPFLEFVKNKDSDFIFTNVFEVFNTCITLSFYSAIFFSVPIICYFFFSFLKSGLYNYEKIFLSYYFAIALKFLLMSFFFTYFFIFPYMLSFLLNLDLITNVDFIVLKMETKLYDYIIFVCKSLFLYCLVIFQIPTLILIVAYLQHPKSSYFYSKRRFWIVFSLILSCLFSSPDLISLFLIAFPLLCFFEIIIFLSILKNNYNK